MFLLLCFVRRGLVYGPATKGRFFLLVPGVPVLVHSSCSSLAIFRLSTHARPNSLQAQQRGSAQIVQIVGMNLAEFPWGEVGSCPTDWVSHRWAGAGISSSGKEKTSAPALTLGGSSKLKIPQVGGSSFYFRTPCWNLWLNRFKSSGCTSLPQSTTSSCLAPSMPGFLLTWSPVLASLKLLPRHPLMWQKQD